MDTAHEAFATSNPGMAIFVRGRTGAAVMLAVAPHKIVCKLTGTVFTEHFLALLQQMREAGHLASDDFSALIDLTEFTGVIDWDEIKKISEVMPKGDCRTNKNAYLVRDAYLAMVAKITAVLFPQTECAAFTIECEARQWLGWA